MLCCYVTLLCIMYYNYCDVFVKLRLSLYYQGLLRIVRINEIIVIIIIMLHKSVLFCEADVLL